MPEGRGEGMIPVMLLTPEDIWEISVSDTCIDTIRRLAKMSGDKSIYCEIAMPDEYLTNVPYAAIRQLDRMYQAGALV